MTLADQLIVLAAGFGAGVLTSTVGVASLLSFPLLVAVGLPPVTANASNTVGLTPGALSGSWGYRDELRQLPRVTAIVLGTCSIGAVAGAALLLALPARVFDAAVPWLILSACVLVAVQPTVRARVVRRRSPVQPDKLEISVPTGVAATITGVYGGYFGAGSGVMMLAVLGLGTDIPFNIANALKTLAVLAGNLTASLIFVFLAPLNWQAIALLAVGSIFGGRLGAAVGRAVPARFMRCAIVAGGAGAATWMLLT